MGVQFFLTETDRTASSTVASALAVKVKEWRKTMSTSTYAEKCPERKRAHSPAVCLNWRGKWEGQRDIITVVRKGKECGPVG